jgi:hypothetical protein
MLALTSCTACYLITHWPTATGRVVSELLGNVLFSIEKCYLGNKCASLPDGISFYLWHPIAIAKNQPMASVGGHLAF